MADQKIAAAFIEVAAKGLQKVQSDLNQIKSKLNETAGAGKTLDDATKKSGESAGQAEGAFKKLGATVSGISAIATKGFFGLTASIGAFVKTADPKGFDDLQLAIFKVTLQLGRFFVPLLHEITEWINRLADYLKSLTDDQREQILHWTKIALVVTGGIVAFSKLFGLLSTGMSVVKGFTSVLGLLGAATPLGWIIGLIGALATLFGMLDSEGEGFGGIFASIGPALQNLVGVFQSVFGRISEFVSRALEVAAPVFEQIAEVVSNTLEQLQPLFEALADLAGTILEALMPVFETLVQTVGMVIEALAPIIPPIIEIITTIIEALKPAFEALISIVQAVVAIVGPVFQLLMAAIRPVIQVLSAVLKPVIEFLGTVIQRVGNVIIDVLNGIIAAINSVLEYVPGTDYVGGRRDFQLQRLGERTTETRDRDREREQPARPERPRREEDPDRFRGQVRQPAAQFVGIAEAWKKLQQAQGEDLQSRIAREQLAETRGLRRGIDRVADNTEPRDEWQGAGGDW